MHGTPIDCDPEYDADKNGVIEASWTGVKFHGDTIPETFFPEPVNCTCNERKWGSGERGYPGLNTLRCEQICQFPVMEFEYHIYRSLRRVNYPQLMSIAEITANIYNIPRIQDRK